MNLELKQITQKIIFLNKKDIKRINFFTWWSFYETILNEYSDMLLHHNTFLTEILF